MTFGKLWRLNICTSEMEIPFNMPRNEIKQSPGRYQERLMGIIQACMYVHIYLRMDNISKNSKWFGKVLCLIISM